MSAWHWPQWTMAGLLVLSVIAGIGKDGQIDPKPRRMEHAFLEVALLVWLLWAGGFWS